MALSTAEARQLVTDFARAYPASYRLCFRLCQTTEELYPGYQGNLGALKGTYESFPHEFKGRKLDGRVNLVAGNAIDVADLSDTLRHEVLGHYGMDTFRPEEKDALLDALIAGQEQRGLRSLWQRTKLEYPQFSDRMQAEEVYAAYCESLPPPAAQERVEGMRREAARSFEEVCVEKSRPMQLADVYCIARMVAQGLHDQSRTQHSAKQQLHPRKETEMNEMTREEAIARADADIERMDTLAGEERDKALEEMVAKAQANEHYFEELTSLAPSLLEQAAENRKDRADQEFYQDMVRERAEQLERIKTMNMLDAARQVGRDLERLELSSIDPRARELELENMAENAQVSRNYRVALETVEPDLLKERDGKPRTLLYDEESMERLRARARSEADVLEHPEDSRSELLAIDDLDLRGREHNYQPGKVELEELRDRVGGKATPEDSKSELLGLAAKERREAEEQARRSETDEAVEDKLRRTKENEQRQYMAGMIDIDNPIGHELGKDEYIVPRSIAQRYVDMDGKYYTKEKQPRVAFEDKGKQLRTSSTDTAVIADMVTLARAKHWYSLKLTGSQEFRREAWLQAESQGIRTAGYTPKPTDLAVLEALRQERATNNIQPVSEREHQADEAPSWALRHDLNKNQAQMHTAAVENTAANLEALKKNPALASMQTAALERLAYWRGIAAEATKREPKPAQEAALVKFDKAAENPDFLKRLERSDTQAKENATNEREAAHRKESELSL